jgi:hypothetical protein
VQKLTVATNFEPKTEKLLNQKQKTFEKQAQASRESSSPPGSY